MITPEQIEAAVIRAEYEKAIHEDWKRRSNGLRGVSSERIALTDEERAALVKRLTAADQFNTISDKLAEESRQRRADEERELVAEWDYARFLKLMRSESAARGIKLVEDQDTLPLIKAICFRLSRNERYETELGLSFKRGLIVHGEPGLGKSYLWSIVAQNPLRPVQIVTMNEIIKSVLETGDYKGLKWASFDQICIDDVGTEYFGDNAIKRYGSDINWLKTFIEEMYAKDKRVLSRVIMTTNDSAEEIGVKYGFRVRDRLAEMFDVIDIKGKSMRRN